MAWKPGWLCCFVDQPLCAAKLFISNSNVLFHLSITAKKLGKFLCLHVAETIN